ncbi:MAG: translation initiation factor IF-2 [Bacillota bacterium]
MTEEVKSKKLRIYKFASEYNLSADTLVEFLRKKGYDVKSHMSPLSDEMMSDIASHFKKDIEKAEKHYQKISEFNKKRAEKSEETVPAAYKEEKAVEVQVPAHTQPEDVPPSVEITHEEEISSSSAGAAEEAELEVFPQISEAEQKEAAAILEQESEVPQQHSLEVEDESEESEFQGDTEPVAVTPAENETAPVSEPESVADQSEALDEQSKQTPSADEPAEIKVYKTRTERELANNKGLTIVGKIDLDANKKKAEKPKPAERGRFDRNRPDNRNRGGEERAGGTSEQQPRRERPVWADRADRPARNIPGGAQQTPGSQPPVAGGVPRTAGQDFDDDKQGLKKKKKKPKAKKKVKGPEPQPEEAVVTKKKKFKRIEIDKRDVDEAIKRTLLSMEDSVIADRANLRKKKKKEKLEEQERRIEELEAEKSKLKVTEFIAVNELANLMKVPVSDVIAKCIGLGIMVSINQRLDVDTITLVADEFGFEVEFEEEYTSEELEDAPDSEESLKSRPPVVTIMGHVDHGKTSLLDRIRSTNVVAGESGGITQHIGAYQVEVNGGKFITFLDTPGHEAFTAMRARGARITDIVVLIVAADDAVMPQTVEAINHAQAAGVPIIIAINKIDKPGANPDKIKQQLADRNILVEDWGGRYQCVEISAKAGVNIEELLEKILLEAEVLELKANPDRMARGTVIESQLDKGRGITGTILVDKGTLKIGDPFVAGVHHGRVRAMFDERNRKLSVAPPATPVLVLGFEGAPQAGDTFVVVNSERDARDISIKRQQLKREQDQRQVHHITLDEIAHQISMGGIKELPLIVKGDVDGSVEALSDSLMKLSNEEVIVRVIHKGVGGISEGDVLLAAASSAIIIGFHVRPNLNARKLAENEKVDIRLYSVIYDAINEVKSALEGLLSPVISEEVVATVEVREVFKVPKVGTIAGCYVQEGKVTRTNKVRLIRQGIVVFEGELDSLRRFKDDVREVDAGYECGLNLHNFNDVKVGDIVEAYKLVETKKKLA